ncbi:MAG TPA: ABC transporter substrate-binding protein [Candidatus Binatia bacterium]|jgi:4,5-dihydroxyphthalate decarboxylase|nr:ABC transporter substrate-binding protein [Candidatus Binatia bacterium]
MVKLTLGFISAFNERVEPLMNGTVQVEGIELIPTYSHPAETFWRQLKFGEFEVAEMSMSSFLIARSQGADMIALPVFPSRRLFQTELSYHVDSGITKPEDLAGKRLGVAEYQQTAALWIRGILEHDFGVSQYKIHWYMERSEEMSHGSATGFKPPEGISFNRIAPNKSLASTLLENELDVAHVASPWALRANTLDRSSRIGGKGDWINIKPLFPDRMAEGARFYKKHGFLPVNHAYIIRGDIYKKYPWVAFNLYNGFVKAKALARANLLERIPSALFFGPEYAEMTREMIGDDPFPYGLKANQPMLDTITEFSCEQGLTPRKMKVEELFAESTLDL